MEPTSRSPLGIDLNQTPSPVFPDTAAPSSDHQALAVVRNLCSIFPAQGAPVGFPGPTDCFPCSLPIDASAPGLVCDACERGFHLACCPDMPEIDKVSLVDHWSCGDCVDAPGESKGWPLGRSGVGRTGVMLLDINALPLSDGEGEVEGRGSHEASELIQGDMTLDGDPVGVVGTNSYFQVNITGFNKAYPATFHDSETHFGNSLYHLKAMDRSMESTKIRYPSGMCGSNDDFVHTQHQRTKFHYPVGVQDMGLNANGLESNDDLPIQYGNFFILSLGKIDLRPSYHDSCHIWPVGYRSCWHDKMTGSLFVCEVMEGGDEGPIFKVRRCSCSAIPIPIGSSVVCMSNLANLGDWIDIGTDYDHEDIIQQFLLDPYPPLKNEISLCLSGNLCEDLDSFDLDESRSFKMPDCNVELLDKIGELSQEGRELSSVWKLLCNKLIELFCQIYKGNGDVKCFCNHSMCKPEIPWHDSNFCVNKVEYESLTKLYGSLGFSEWKSVIPLDGKVETLSDMLTKWLEQDRFGLDVQFVQEIIEHLPGVSALSDYNILGKRKELLVPLTIKSGFLVVHTKTGIVGQEGDTPISLLKGYHKDDSLQPLPQKVEVPCLPLGKPLGTVLPPILVGDALQVLEFLCRFHEILGLKAPPSFEELEKDLMSPWLDCSELTDRLRDELTRSEDVPSYGDVTYHTNDEILFSTIEHNTADCNNDSAIPISTGAMRETMNVKLALRTYKRFAGVGLTRVHCSMLKLVVTELLSRVALIVDPNLDTGEQKSKRVRKRDAEGSVPFWREKLSMLPISEYTWPEVARRYILAVIAMNGNVDSVEISNRESGKLFRCLQGDGGVLCGCLTGVTGMEGDALLLAEAKKKIFGTMEREGTVLALEEEVTVPSDEFGTVTMTDNEILPDWVLVLEPVRKLPTNVGTRIRNRVNDALSKGPPEWARDILQHSISKEVYKGNASGPTKKAVISVLDSIRNGAQIQRPAVEKRRSIVSIRTSNIVANQCRIILRRAAAEDDARIFCNLLGRKIMKSSDNDDEGLLGSPAMVSRPLDFRTIDLRLAVGAYDGSHNSFLEDVRELWNNVRTVFSDQPEVIALADTLFTNFEVMYEKEVLTLVERLKSMKVDSSSDKSNKDLKDIISSTSEIPKAPWDEGVCKICGIDKDDDSVLLCDTCDAEYHRYCLDPPLAKIPEGNWYCPSCLVGKAESSAYIDVNRHGNKKKQGQYNCHQLELLSNLAASMGEREYWELDVYQRMFLLKFLCDEVLTTSFLRQHLESCADNSLEMQQKLRSVSNELKNLKVKKDILITKASKVDRFSNFITEDISKAERSDLTVKKHGRNSDVPPGVKKKCISFSSTDCPKPSDGLDSPGIITEDKENSVNLCDEMMKFDDDVVELINTDDVHAVPAGIAVHGLDIPPVHASKDQSSPGKTSLLLPTSGKEDAGALTKAIPLQADTQEFKGKELNVHLLSPDLNNIDVLESASDVSVTEANTDDRELNAIKSELLLLQDSVMCIESQLLDQNVRREFLGCDSVLQLYWVSSRPGRAPWVIVDRSMAMHHGSNFTDHVKHMVCKLKPLNTDSVSTQVDFKESSYIWGLENNSQLSSWVSYHSDDELGQLISWLSHNPKDGDLKESIMHVQRLIFNQNSKGQNVVEQEPALSKYSNKASTLYPDSLGTRALAVLGIKHISCFTAENNKSSRKVGTKSISNNEEKMLRCDCLEVLNGRHHCFSCHRTFYSDAEMAGHVDSNFCMDMMPLINTKSDANSAGVKNGVNSEAFMQDRLRDGGIIESFGCPFNLKEICSKFRTNDSNKEVVRGIGLIGSNGVPSLVHIDSPYLNDPTLSIVPRKLHGADVGAGDGNGPQTSHFINDVEDRTCFGGCPTSVTTYHSLEFERPSRNAKKNTNFSLNSFTFEMEGTSCCAIPQSSLTLQAGEKFQLFRHLKINLLDVEAALPDAAIKASKAHTELRWAWREFVKSAKTIFQMVQATIVLEDIIKAEYFRNSWWYWSSLTAAAKVSTLSSLALRIYALDAVIIYDRGLEDVSTANNTKNNGNVDQTQFIDSLSPDKTKASRRLNKKRKEHD
uniref:Methyl-CpG-binding domain-containing protein 9 n=2 Tax=Kalanchoe fedtschenkoi TaxID=63787 RepID=A0A7N0VDH2_KALFE